LKKEWQFSIDYFPFHTVYKQELLSEVKDISKYIRDEQLLEKQRQLKKTFCLIILKERRNYLKSGPSCIGRGIGKFLSTQLFSNASVIKLLQRITKFQS